MESTLLVTGIILAYLLGSIPSAVWVGKTFYGIDVRTQGSGNAGATNTIRVLGARAGIPVLLMDVLKGWAAVYLCKYFVPEFFTMPQTDTYKITVAAAVVLGHVFPLFAGFKGGKGIATLLGVGIALFPIAVLVIIGIFVVILILTKYVSLSSITAAISFPFMVIFLFNPGSLPLIILSVFVGIFVPITHRKNINRLLNGTESKFSLKKKKQTPPNR
ncbi:MAG: glycerol-3-phosphate 1-O-acyltransferase PlsY [Bacteroidales bacterium]|nr:glycerol-3-phosphate 1-O-acyltransferase PlsY [Bacteroidales bacterium]